MGKLEKHDGTENTDILKVKNSIKGLYHGWRLYKLKWREDWMSLMNYRVYSLIQDVFDAEQRWCKNPRRDLWWQISYTWVNWELGMIDLLQLGRLGARDGIISYIKVDWELGIADLL